MGRERKNRNGIKNWKSASRKIWLWFNWYSWWQLIESHWTFREQSMSPKVSRQRRFNTTHTQFFFPFFSPLFFLLKIDFPLPTYLRCWWRYFCEAQDEIKYWHALYAECGFSLMYSARKEKLIRIHHNRK